MQLVARFNPLTYLVDAQRSLFAGDLASATVLGGILAGLVTVALGLVVGIRGMSRSAD